MTGMPAAVWPMTYARSRRKHSHRCQGCRRIIQVGERVIMARVSGKTTRCAHKACAELRTAGGTCTVEELMEAQGMTYLARVGWRQAQRWIETSPLCQTRGNRLTPGS